MAARKINVLAIDALPHSHSSAADDGSLLPASECSAKGPKTIRLMECLDALVTLWLTVRMSGRLLSYRRFPYFCLAVALASLPSAAVQAAPLPHDRAEDGSFLSQLTAFEVLTPSEACEAAEPCDKASDAVIARVTLADGSALTLAGLPRDAALHTFSDRGLEPQTARTDPVRFFSRLPLLVGDARGRALLALEKVGSGAEGCLFGAERISEDTWVIQSLRADPAALRPELASAVRRTLQIKGAAAPAPEAEPRTTSHWSDPRSTASDINPELFKMMASVFAKSELYAGPLSGTAEQAIKVLVVDVEKQFALVRKGPNATRYYRVNRDGTKAKEISLRAIEKIKKGRIVFVYADPQTGQARAVICRDIG